MPPRLAPKIPFGLAALALAALVPPAAAQAPCCGGRPTGPPPLFATAPPPPVRCGPPPCRPGLLTGYLPRTANVPLYNEPPARGPRW